MRRGEGMLKGMAEQECQSVKDCRDWYLLFWQGKGKEGGVYMCFWFLLVSGMMNLKS